MEQLAPKSPIWVFAVVTILWRKYMQRIPEIFLLAWK
jgi:hypothetical protein